MSAMTAMPPWWGGSDAPTSGWVLAVVGASGGAGASCLAAALAVAAAPGRGSGSTGPAVVAVDLDGGGAGLDVVLGVEHVPGLRWADLAACDGPDAAEIGSRLPEVGGVSVLAHGRDGRPPPRPEVVAAVVTALRRAGAVVVADLARGWAGGWAGGEVVVASAPDPTLCVDQSLPVDQALPVDPALCVDRVLPVDQAILVAGTGLLELAALASTAALVAPRVADTGIGLRRGSRAIADDVESALDLPVLALVPEDPGVPRDLVRGRPPGSRRGPFADCVARLAAEMRRPGRQVAR